MDVEVPLWQGFRTASETNFVPFSDSGMYVSSASTAYSLPRYAVFLRFAKSKYNLLVHKKQAAMADLAALVASDPTVQSSDAH